MREVTINMQSIFNQIGQKGAQTTSNNSAKKQKQQIEESLSAEKVNVDDYCLPQNEKFEKCVEEVNNKS